MTNLAVVTLDQGDTVGGTAVTKALIDPSSTAPDFTANTMVTHFDLSLADPSAVVELTIGRIEPDTRTANGSQVRYFRGNTTDGSMPRWANESLSFHHVLGRYYFSGGQPLQLTFTEAAESLENAETGTDQAFAYKIQRLDSSTAVGYYVNVWYHYYR